MTYHHYAPNGWGGLRTAEQKMQDAFDQRRKQWYGSGWFTLDFWGLPITQEPKLGRK